MYHYTKLEFSGYLNFIRHQNENLPTGHEIISKALKRYRISEFLKIESRIKLYKCGRYIQKDTNNFKCALSKEGKNNSVSLLNQKEL